MFTVAELAGVCNRDTDDPRIPSRRVNEAGMPPAPNAGWMAPQARNLAICFDDQAPKTATPSAEVRAAIENRFGTLDKWWADFAASGKEASGWAMLVKHPINGKLYNVVSDEHAMGLLCIALPLVVIDVYEHAFYLDYQSRKAEYVDKFRDHIDWTEANTRFRFLTR